MKVFVLLASWDNEASNGCEILGVYSKDNLEKAREDMRNNVSEIKSEYADDVWQDDYTWEEDDSVHLGFEQKDVFQPSIQYSWEIVSQIVQGA